MRRILPAFLFIFSSCQISPIFNHAPAPQSTPSPSSEEKSISECPLYFESKELCGNLSWISYPTDKEMGTLSLTFWSKESGSSDGPFTAPPGKIHIYFWMPEHGHGSSPVRITGDHGQYQIEDVFFIMPGNWDLHIQLLSEETTLDENVVKYVVP